MALAPPPGTTLRSRCCKISTGASRETREIAPKTNSSATRSASTVTVSLGKDSTIFLRRPFSLLDFVINLLDQNLLAQSGATKIFSRAVLRFRNDRQNGIHNSGWVAERELERGDGEWFEEVLLRREIDSVFFRRKKTDTLKVATRADKSLNVVEAISMMVAKLDFCRGRNSGGAHLGKELFWTRNAAESNGG